MGQERRRNGGHACSASSLLLVLAQVLEVRGSLSAPYPCACSRAGEKQVWGGTSRLYCREMCEWDTILGQACKNEEDRSKWSKSKGTSASVLSRAGMQVGSFRSPFVLRGGGNLGGPGREHEDTSSDQCVGAGQEDLEFEAPVQNDRCTLHLCLGICLIYRLPQVAHCNLSVTSTLNTCKCDACMSVFTWRKYHDIGKPKR